MELEPYIKFAESSMSFLKDIFAWILLLVFGFSILAIFFHVGDDVYYEGSVSTETIVVSMGTVLLLTMAVKAFKIVNEDLGSLESMETVLKIAIIGVVVSFLHSTRDFMGGEVTEVFTLTLLLAMFLAVTTIGYYSLENIMD